MRPASSSTEHDRTQRARRGRQSGAALVESVLVIGMLVSTLVVLMSVKSMYEAKIEVSRPMRNAAWQRALAGCSTTQGGLEAAKSLISTLWAQLSHPDLSKLLRVVFVGAANPPRVGSAPEISVSIQRGSAATAEHTRIAADPITMPCTIATTSCCADLDLTSVLGRVF